MARDLIHDAVKNALLKDKWVITADPYTVPYKDVEVYADLAAERPVAAERNGHKIAVEIKSFAGRSGMHELHGALGQYQIYRMFLEQIEPERELYLAIASRVYETFFQLKAIQHIVERYQLSLLVVDLQKQEIVTWKRQPSIDQL